MTDETLDIDGASPDFKSELAQKLEELAPEAIADGKIDVKKLDELLGDDAADDDNERFGLYWPGKRRALQAAQAPTTATLKPRPDISKEWDTTKNVFIEGDNLEVLKVLQRHYFGKVKMIYIDPPYNTGNDFVYPDNYREGLQSYLEFTSQVDEGGKRLSSNSESDGRFHSNWLNMMYPRLKVARNLLADDGAIFVSIDFNEIATLKLLLDEVFGERNFQREIVWRIGWLSGYKTAANNFIRNHDTMLFYSRDPEKIAFIKKYIDNSDFKPLVKKDRSLTEKLEELGIDKNGQNDLLQFINHENRPDRYPIEDTWNSNEYDDLNSIAIVSFSGEKVSKLLGINEEFKGQKSVKMLRRVLESMTSDNDLVMDFFAGSGSTAHAVMQLNAEDGGKRRHIMVQLPEPTPEDSEAHKAGFKTISGLGRERIDLAGEMIRESQTNSDTPLDVGYRTYELAETNFKKWNVSNDASAEHVVQQLDGLRDSSDDDATADDLLTELLLKLGYSLSESIETTDIAGLQLRSVRGGAVLAHVDEHTKPSRDQLRAVVAAKPQRLIVLEDAFQGDDELKANLVQECKTHGVELKTA